MPFQQAAGQSPQYSHEDRGDQQKDASHAGRHVDELRSGYELSSLELYDDERLCAGAVDRLLLHQASSSNSEHNEAGRGKCDDTKTTVLLVSDSCRSPVRCRKIYAWSTLGQAALDLCIAATAIYFIAFAIMAISYKGESEASSTVQNLLTAARFVSLPLTGCLEYSSSRNHRVPLFGRSCSLPSSAGS